MMLLKQLIELFLGLPDYSEALCIVAQMKDLKHRFKSKKRRVEYVRKDIQTINVW